MFQLHALWLLAFYLSAAYALKCHTEDGMMDADLKRVARACMRRMSEPNYKISQGGGTSGGGGGGESGSNWPSHQQAYGEHNQYGDEHYNNNNNNHNYNNNNNKRYDYDYNDEPRNWHDQRDDLQQQRNRQRMQHFGLSSSRAAHGSSGSGGGGGGGAGGGGGSGGGSGGSNGSSGSNGGHHRTGATSSSSSSSSSNSNRSGQGRANNGTHDESACITLCFFEEMNMLNSDDYPDRQKMNYMLTKDLRSRELRNFYTDTLQECFRYLENQRRRDRCQYSRELVKCMTEYAKANCDDWDEYESLIFN